MYRTDEPIRCRECGEQMWHDRETSTLRCYDEECGEVEEVAEFSAEVESQIDDYCDRMGWSGRCP